MMIIETLAMDFNGKIRITLHVMYHDIVDVDHVQTNHAGSVGNCTGVLSARISGLQDGPGWQAPIWAHWAMSSGRSWKAAAAGPAGESGARVRRYRSGVAALMPQA